MTNIFLNDLPIKVSRFPNKEIYFSIDTCRKINNIVSTSKELVVSWSFRTNEDILALQFLRDFISRLDPQVVVDLNIHFLPYSRMDRSEAGMAFTLQSVSRMINMMNFNKIGIFDAHSDVSLALIDNASKMRSKTKPDVELPEYFITEVMKDMKFDESKDMILYPDLGAAKRGANLTKNLLIGNKKRDFATGEIEKFEIIGTVIPGGRVLIVDDLCSYGGTAIHAAEELRSLGVTDISFYISHCEDSAFKGDLFNHIENLYTTDSLLDVVAARDISVKGQFKKLHVFNVLTELPNTIITED